MRKEDCFYVGSVANTFSFKGEILVKLDTDDLEMLLEMESVFIEIGKNLVPFFIEKSSIHKNTLWRLKLEDVSDEDEAMALIKKNLYLPLSLLPELTGNKFYYHEVIGWKLVDAHEGEMGLIDSINDSAAQALFLVKSNSGEMYVPIIDQFIKNVNRDLKQIEVELPSGFTELFRS